MHNRIKEGQESSRLIEPLPLKQNIQHLIAIEGVFMRSLKYWYSLKHFHPIVQRRKVNEDRKQTNILRGRNIFRRVNDNMEGN